MPISNLLRFLKVHRAKTVVSGFTVLESETSLPYTEISPLHPSALHMRFVLTDEFWALDALTPAEWHLVAELPAASDSDAFSPATRERLFPSLFSPDALVDEDTQSHLEDWDQFVTPDLKDTFDDARALIAQDIAKVESFEVEEMLEPEYAEMAEGVPELKRLRVPIEHTESWYSVLNQARLMMNEEFDLAESDDRLLLQFQDAENVDQDRLMLLAQYEIYSVIQSILVENVMNL